MKRLLSLLMMAIMFAMQLSAQTTVVVGDTTSTNTSPYLPMYMYYQNSFSESIYPASSLQQGMITSISYYVSSGSYSNGTMKIYMKEVDNSTLSSFMVGNDFTEVYSGPASVSVGRNTFQLTTPFAYTGAGNLLIAVIRDGTAYSSSYPNFRQVSNGGSSTYLYSDGTEYFITTNPGSGSSVTRVPVIKLEMNSMEGFCYPPSDITYSGLGQTEATINWTIADENITTFGLAYKTTTEEEWTIASENITDLSYSLSGLESYTEYQVKLWSVCDEENSNERIISFWTLPQESDMIEIPYEQNFDDLESLENWDLWTVSGTGANQWYLGPLGSNEAVEEGETPMGQGLYISNDNGVTNSYDPDGDAAVAHLATLINIEDDTYYGIEFDYKAVGELSWDEVVVSLFPLGTTLPTTNDVPSSMIGRSASNANQWVRVAIPFPNDIAPGAYQLVISWRNDGSGGENPAASIDNLYISSTTCARVNEFTTTMEDADGSVTMNVEVTDELNEGAEYIVEYRYAGDTTWYSVQGESPIAITDLPYTSRVDYKVTASCSGGELAVVSDIFTDWTICGDITEFPYEENFDQSVFIAIQDSARANRTSLNCWYNINGGYEYYYWSSLSSGDGLEESKALYFYGTTSTYSYDFSDWMITPVFELTGNERLNFQYKYTSASNAPVIDVMVLDVSETDYTTMADTANFTLLGTVNCAGQPLSEYNMAEFFLNEYSGSVRLALAVRQKSSTFYIDDFAISEIPDCPDVYGLSVAPGQESAYVSYDTGNIGESGVVVAYAETVEGEEFDPESATTVTISAEDALPFLIEGLTEGATYTFVAQQACGGAWSDPVTITIPICYTLPISFDFDTPETTPEMEFTSNSANVWLVGTAENNTVDEAGNPTTGGSLYISNNNGTSASYTGTSTVAYASFPIAITPSLELSISFDWKAEAESSWDHMKVHLVPSGQSFESGINVAGAEYLEGSPTWQTQTLSIPASNLAGVYDLTFYWKNDGIGNYPPGAVVDNIKIESFTCTSSALNTSVAFVETEESETGGSFEVGLTDEVNEGVSYVLRYKEATSGEWIEIPDLTIDDFPYTINEIAFQTAYQVQVGVICVDGEEPNYAGIISNTTPCQALPTPWYENFDVDPYTAPSCWERYTGLLPASGTIQTSELSDISTSYTSSYCWSWVSNYACGETTSSMLHSELYSSSSYIFWAISPSINLADDGVAKQIAFDLGLRNYGSNVAPGAASDDRVMVLVSLDNGTSWNIANGIVFADGDEDTEHNYSDLGLQMQRYAYKLVDENEEPLTGQVRFAFYSESTVSNADNWVCIDNVAVEDYNDCPAPYSPQVSATTITSTTATASFSTWGPATTWEYVVVEGEGEEADPESGTPVEITTTEGIELTDLSPETVYTFAVRAVCEEGNSPWATVSFMTLASSESVPYETTFDDGTWFVDNGANTPNAWIVGEETGNEAPAAYVSNDGSTYAATTNSSQTITHLWKDFDFGETEDEFELTFDWKVTGYQEGTSVYGGIAAYLVDCTPLPTSGLLNSANIIAIVTGSDEWQTERVYLGNVTGEKRLVFTAIGYTTDAELVTPAAIDNVSLIVTPCSRVHDIVVENITESTMNIAWTATEADSYVVTYVPEGMEDAEEMTVTASEPSVTLTDLVPTTRYIITVTAVCGSVESVASSAITVITQEPAELPYTCTFEEEGDNGWLLRNSTCTNQWYVGTRTGGTSRELFISSDGGTSATYSASAGVVVAEKLFQLGATDSIRISFDVTVNGESTFDYLKVFFVDPTVAINPTTDPDVSYASNSYSTGTIGGAIINQQSGTVNKVITIENPALNGLKKLVFLWRNDGSIQNNPPAIIDNVSVEGAGEEVTCVKPTAVVASAITITSATISWTDNDESHSAWNVYYKAAGEEEYTSVPASETSIELTDLSASTTYSVYVTTDCGDEESNPTTPITFTTTCGIIVDFPFFEGFEASTECWSMEYISGSQPWSVTDVMYVDEFDTEAYPVEGDALMYHTFGVGESAMLVSPTLDLTSLTNPYVKFNYVLGAYWSSAEDLTIKYRTSAEDAWVTLVTYTTPVSQWALDSIALPNPSATYQIGFLTVGVDGYGVGLDAITVYDAEGTPDLPEPEPCDAPTALAASNITQTTAEISWNGTATSYEFKLNGETAEALTATTKSLTGLTANTQYTVEVRSVCDDQTSDWVTTTFTTLQESGGEVIAPVVTTLAATAITHESATLNGTITVGSETITAQGFMYKATAAATWTTVNATGTTMTATVANLTAETAYTFKAFATTASGTVEGTAMTFTTTAAPIVAPVVTTLAATAVDHESAVLNGTITAGSETITAQGFMYKATAAADWTTVNATGETISATLSALTAETEYTFKAFATTASGTVEGTAMTFTTTAAPIVAPVVTTLAATAVDHESATLNGTITAGSETITAQGFMYKATAAADWTTVNATGTTITATLTALTAETEYTFKAFATTASGTVEGTAMTFTTSATPIVAPTVVTLAATEITNATAKLNGTITAGSEDIIAQGFMYKASNATDWATVAAVGETMSLTVEGLEAELEYVFKAFATTASGTTEGEELTFTTLSGLSDVNSVSIIANVYPNPAEDKATVSVSNVANGTKIVVSDMQGRIILSDEMSESTYELNTSNYASGVYYIRIISGNAVNTQKLIVK